MANERDVGHMGSKLIIKSFVSKVIPCVHVSFVTPGLLTPEGQGGCQIHVPLLLLLNMFQSARFILSSSSMCPRVHVSTCRC